MSKVSYGELVNLAQRITEQTPKKVTVAPALKPGQEVEDEQSDTIQPVTVVPTLAPNTIPSACG